MDDTKIRIIKTDFALIKNCLDGIEIDKFRTEGFVESEISIIRRLITELETLIVTE